MMVCPSVRWQKRFGLRDSHPLVFCRRVGTDPLNGSGRLVETGAVYLRKYGQGLIFYCPYFYRDNNSVYDKKHPTTDLRRLIVDLARGMLLGLGQQQIAAQFVVPAGKQYGYILASVESGRRSLYIDLGLEPSTMPLAERDLWMGRGAPSLGQDQTVAMILRSSER